MIKLPKLFKWNEIDPIDEGIMAHQIKDDNLKKIILEKYNERYRPEPTPFTHPENYDPFNPPDGWAYDPYYECWIKLNE